jgi:G:T-mismatch repair DNA endonuclease (very short patch repair protein)
MVDIVDQGTRSRMMSGIRAKNTKLEILVRKYFHAKGLRFRLYVKKVAWQARSSFPEIQVRCLCAWMLLASTCWV